MSKQTPRELRIFVTGEGQAYTLAQFAGLGLETEAAVSTAYEGQGAWHTVRLRRITAGLDTEANHAARTLGPGGFCLDLTLLPRARTLAAVSEWTFTDDDGRPVPVSEAGYDALPAAVARLVDGEVGLAFAGGTDERFFALWRSRQAPSGTEPVPPGAPGTA